MKTTSLEQALLGRCFARTLDACRRPITKQGLIERCVLDVRFGGNDATTELYIKGTRGQAVKTKRRLFPSGPLGEILFSNPGWLYVSFPAAATLDALGERTKKCQALAHYFEEAANPPYPLNPPLALVTQMAEAIVVKVAIEQEVLEAMYTAKQKTPPWLRCSYSYIFQLLQIEDAAVENRWKRVNLAQLKESRMDWLVK